MKLRVVGTDLHVLNMRTRMPFRYGITTLTAVPHLFVRVELEIDGVAVKIGHGADAGTIAAVIKALRATR